MFVLIQTWRKQLRSAPILAALAVFVLAPHPVRAQQDDSVSARISRLEAEIATLKVMVGTLESLVRAKPSATFPQEDLRGSAPLAAEEDLGPRVEALETQIGALTNQIEQIGRQLDALEAKLAAAPQAATPVPQAAPPQAAAPAPQAAPPPVDTGDPSKPRWYGPRPETGAADDDGTPRPILPQGDTVTGSVAPDDPLGGFMSSLPDENAQALYEQGYGDYLQRDYAGAEKAFGQLVKQYPDDPLAGSAQYWVGETYYVRGQYKKAADAFLAGYRKYSSGDKAPDSLLKLGMSLGALGQKDAACSSFDELKAKFPDAPDHIRDQARGEAKKAGC